jgi:hypothetical protein
MQKGGGMSSYLPAVLLHALILLLRSKGLLNISNDYKYLPNEFLRIALS